MPSAASVTPQWVFHPRRSPERAADLARALDAPLPVAHALVNRGMDTLERARRFLAPAIEDLHDPREMLDLERAAERILAAVQAGERIFIQGDYDVDGITSTFLLHSCLTELGARVEYRIPHRIRDGYGLSLEAIDEAQRRGCTLVVTVDCGITAHAAIEAARERGIETVVTDHHEPTAVLPDAVAVVNPLRPGCAYPFKSLAGVGVTFKLVERLFQGRGGIDHACQYLDVVALGTIADVVPLVGENRILARLGLDQMNHAQRLGLRALIEVAGLAGRRISSGQVAFVLAPRINAAGRMGNAEQGLRLLMAREWSEALDIARSLEDDNERRRKFDEAALIEAGRRVEQELSYPECCSILLWSEEWHPGVIGIVASRLVERYQRPAILVALDGARGRGSGRSLPGLDLTRLLDGCTDLLVAHGGHAFAAGLTVEREQLPALRERIERLVREQYRPELFVPRLDVDSELRVSECDEDLIGWLERMAPHGLDNPEPMFQLLGARIDHVTRVGKDRHVRFAVHDESSEVEAIGFGMGELAPALARSGRADLVFVPTRNEWRPSQTVQLKLKAARLP
ncbi:MAG TPA: single-stranded-DNA-specific exonuclease RecJ [Candidatus Acidoferrales bacterium]|nr:single-stranded-DNA-specific exonuclease RecJ [Candidatus Acidoferrales bacterium]